MLLVAAAAILAGVVVAALGRAGEMATFAGDTAPLELDEVSATDVALLRPPMSLWGYNAQATEDALRVIARSVTARDVEIATLRRELADLRADPGSPRAGSRGTRADPGSTRADPGGRRADPGGTRAGSGDLRAARAGDRPTGQASSAPRSQLPEPGPDG